jgi:hypothetical protein
MLNSELLKEAIADAKAVRATALANAKAALEEAFRPRFEAMFAEKLKEDSEEEEEGASMDEVSAPNQVHSSGGEAKGPKTKDVTKGQPHKGSAAKKDFKTIAVGGSEGAAGAHAPAAKQSIVKETSEEDDEGKKMDEQYEEDEARKMDEAGMTSEELDEIIHELEAEVAGEEEGGHVEEPAAEAPPVEAPAPEGGEGGEGDGLPEVPHDEPDGDEAMPHTELGNEEPHIDVPVDGGEGDGVEGTDAPPVETPELPPVKGGDEDINLDELLAALNEEAEEEDEGKVEEGKLPPWLKKKGNKEEDDEGKKEDMDEAIKNHGVPKNVSGQDAHGGTNTYPKGPDASKKQLPGKNHNISGKGNIGTGATGGKPMEENIQLKSEVNECVRTIEFLRGQINEVNLLNAKLLYTNKLFKEFAQVLDDPYRMKIVEAFDLTKSVREVKLAYALLAESLNFGTQVQKARMVKTTPKQSVRQITEGLASGRVASTKPSANLITEGSNEMADRFKKLAGIKTPQPTIKK